MAWWIHDHLPTPILLLPYPAAFNIRRHEQPKQIISSYVAPKGTLTKPGMPNHAGSQQSSMRDSLICMAIMQPAEAMP